MTLIPFAGKDRPTHRKSEYTPARDRAIIISLQAQNKKLGDENYKLRSDKLQIERDLRICRAEKLMVEDALSRISSITAMFTAADTIMPGRLTIEEVIYATCAHYSVSEEEVRGYSRQREPMMARHIAMYLASTLVGSTSAHVGRVIGNRDHSTVMHAIKRIRRIMPHVAHDIALIKARLQNTSTNSVLPRGEGVRVGHDHNLVPPEKDGADPL